uniref:Sphingomyelin synthase-like domain-containing protein n=2 Tax=Toxoplasma gondii TaxID=5811 RepID=A0A0F7VAM6_TOXGV|nr:TPA: hypothetical protein BN1205_005500 [Toxoplasma gondii VEG]
MAESDSKGLPAEEDQVPALWATVHSVKFYLGRFVLATLYVFTCVYLMCLCSVASDTFFDPRTQKSLPDRIHDQMLDSKPLFFATPFVVDAVTVGIIIVTIFRHAAFLKVPLNLLVGTRFLFLLGSLYMCRGIAIIITTVPPSRRNCVPPPVMSVGSFFYLGVLQMFSMRNECTGMIISGHSTITCCCMATWLLYGNANREDQDTKGVLFYEVARFLATRLQKVRASARQLTTQYAITPAFDVEEGSETVPQAESEEELSSASGVFVQEDRRKTRVAAFLRLNLLRSLCLVVGVVNLCLIVCSFNHYSIDVFMALNFTFGAWCLYHCILSLIWAEKEERDKRQKVALLRSEGIAAGAATDSDADALSEASTVSSLESGALVTGSTVKKAEPPNPPKENKPGFSAINFPLVRIGVSIVRAIEGL